MMERKNTHSNTLKHTNTNTSGERERERERETERIERCNFIFLLA